MAAITYGTTGLFFGVLNPETGVLTKSVNRSAMSGSKEVMNENGDIVGHGAYAFKAEYTIHATTLDAAGPTGIAASGIGTIYALANVNNYNGISGGHVILKKVDTVWSQENFKEFTASLTQYPAI